MSLNKNKFILISTIWYLYIYIWNISKTNITERIKTNECCNKFFEILSTRSLYKKKKKKSTNKSLIRMDLCLLNTSK